MVDEYVACCGFPYDKHVLVGVQTTGSRQERTIALRPELFFGQVLSGPNFPTNDFDSTRHYLVPYRHHDSNHPKGFSGAAAWWEKKQPLKVWRPNFKFAGICTHAYKDGAIERIIKASVVRRFLEEVLGPAQSPKPPRNRGGIRADGKRRDRRPSSSRS